MFTASTNQMQVIHTNRPRLEDIKLHYIIIKRTFFETKLHPPPPPPPLICHYHTNFIKVQFSLMENMQSFHFYQT